MKQINPGDCYDCQGVPIHPGDLCRSYHFTEARYRRIHYLYHVAIFNEQHKTMELVPSCQLDPKIAKKNGGRVWLDQQFASGVTVIHGSGPGDCLCHYDRKKIKPVPACDKTSP